MKPQSFKDKFYEASIMFLIQLVNYTLLVVNYRAIAQANYFWSGLTDFTVASFQFFVIKKISKSDDSFHLWLGFSLGGLAGSIVGIWVSMLIHGQ
jgi:hypothetical protein